MSPFAIDDHAGAVTTMVRAASRASLEWYRRPIAVDNKLADGYDPVTEADRAVEDEIRKALGELFPDHAILGEERGETGSGPLRWTIDPIDGTRAFVSGQPMWGTLVGFQVDGKPVAGWMHQPVLDETLVATPAGGSLIIGDPAAPSEERPLACRTTVRLDQAILLCTHPEMFDPGWQQDGFARLDAAVQLTRYSGDCVNYGLLAAGQIDLVVENGLALYDIVPLIPIVESAGGIITDLDGCPPLEGGFVVAAATPELHAAVLDLFDPAT